MGEIKPVYQAKAKETWGWHDYSKEEFDPMVGVVFATRILYPAAAYEAQSHRANALALVVNDLTNICTHTAETKEQFIERVKSILSVDPDLRISEMQVDYEALQKENAELRKQSRRYENIRKLNAQQFAELYKLNIQDGIGFDDLVDGLFVKNGGKP